MEKNPDIQFRSPEEIKCYQEEQLAEALAYLQAHSKFYQQGLTKKSPPKKKFSLSADMRELLCIFRLPNQCKYT